MPPKKQPPSGPSKKQQSDKQTPANADSSKKGSGSRAPSSATTDDRVSVRELVGGKSWTGKLPMNLLHEHCQKSGWLNPDYGYVRIPLSRFLVAVLLKNCLNLTWLSFIEERKTGIPLRSCNPRHHKPQDARERDRLLPASAGSTRRHLDTQYPATFGCRSPSYLCYLCPSSGLQHEKYSPRSPASSPAVVGRV